MRKPFEDELIEFKRTLLRLRHHISMTTEINQEDPVWDGLVEGERQFHIAIRILYGDDVWRKIAKIESAE